MAKPFKHSQTGVYYLRVGVPSELRPLAGKREIKKSLGTKDPKEAKRLFIPLYQDTLNYFESLRAKKIGFSPELTPKDIAALTDKWFAHQVSKYDALGDWSALGAFNMPERENDSPEWVSTFDLETYEYLSEADLEGRWDNLQSLFQKDLDTLLANNGLYIQVVEDSYRQLLVSVAKKQRKLCDLARKRVSGDWSVQVKLPLQEAPLSTESNQSVSQSILSVFSRYEAFTKAEQGGEVAKLGEYRSSIERFVSLIGDKSINEVSPKDCAYFRDTLLMSPVSQAKHIRKLSLLDQVKLAEKEGLKTLSANTVKNKLVHLSALMTYAVGSALIEDNPVTKIAKPKAKATLDTTAKDYTKSELAKIFTSRAFTEGANPFPLADYGEAFYWLPLLCYYTGARPKELGQLYVKDVHFDGDISFLAITDSEDDQSVKRKASHRVVPLHSDLVKLGFKDYVAQLDSAGRLFPDLKYSDNSYTSSISKKFGEYLRSELDIAHDKRPLYAFRDTFKSTMRSLRVSEDIHDKITGHAGVSVGRVYGTEWLGVLNEAVQKLPSVPKVEDLKTYPS